MQDEKRFGLVIKNNYMEYFEEGDVTLLEILMGISMLKDVVMLELEVTDETIDKDQAFLQALKAVSSQMTYEKELLN